MLTAHEADEVIALLEGRDAPEVVGALFAAIREPWLVRGLLNYHARTGSTRVLDHLARAPEPHARLLLDALVDHLRADRSARHQALAAIAPLVARRPAWLHRLSTHPVARELMRAARLERSPLASLHALLSLAALLPAEPALAASHLPELADALLRPPALESPPPPQPVRDHLLLARLALFHALYATHPCTLLDTLRAECAAAPARDSFERALAPLLRSVRLHPHLVTGSRQREADPARWARVELHDVLVEARRLSLLARDPPEDRAPATVAPAPLRPPASASPAPGSGAHAARAASALRPGAEPWFPLADRCGAESAPNTPLPAEPESAEAPEAAVEATPENTPAKDARTQFRFPNDSAVVRAIGRRSRPPSPPRKETSPPVGGEAYAGRLARVALERRAAESPVPFGGGPPPAGAVPRPEPSRAVAAACEAEPLNVEDREVLELTERAGGEAAWDSGDGGTPAWRDPRAKAPRREGARRAPPARRASSCSPALRSRTSEAAAQTVDTWPAPYEFLIADFFRSLPDAEQTQTDERGGEPCERLDAYLADLYSGKRSATAGELAEQLALVHAQLMYERWRREAHAERNRRLLGRCRRTRMLELQNAALRERLRASQRERDELASRPPRDPPPATLAPPDRRLEDALADETVARLRAEAALEEAEAQRALDAAELRRTRGEAFETARRVEALARATLAAERRAERARRLRRELVAVGEDDARRGRPGAGSGDDAKHAAEAERLSGELRAARAALARAEAEAESAAARGEAAATRAHELEAALAAREAGVVELKRVSRAAAEEHAARVRALQDKYAALVRVARAAEAHGLERKAREQLRPAAVADGAL
ncbi:unnamed protein product [Pieris macdunnoughi]|uniref:Hamartin n=1 Tax=Pieris macdunnoughi TaxID=345717 RepID=A0A821MB21_9NEOP|nr:unnamed protein product [Pieris macdunnoughi]